jgi:predicted dehydrogenase
MIRRILDRLKKYWRHTPLGRTRKCSNPIRWGVIGLGYMAETFSCAIDGNKNGVVYAVASRSLAKAKSFASHHGNCKAYGNYEEMVNDKELNLDVVYIATPVKYHYEHVKLCLEAGLNVLCEKPITSTFEQFEDLVAIAKGNNCFFMEGMWMKCLPTFQKACQWVNEGKIGKTELVKVDFYKREHICEGYAIYNAKEGGGVLHDFGVYAIAFMEHFIGGMPEDLNRKCRISASGIDADWLITAEKNGINAVVNLSSNFGSLSKAAIIGSDGFIEFDSQFNRTKHVTLYDSKGQQVENFSTSYIYEGFEYEVNEVQKNISGGKKESRIATLVGTHNTMQIIDKLKKV